MKKFKNKKVVAVIVLIVVVLAGGVFAFSKMRGGSDNAQKIGKKKKILEPKNIIDVALRPYMKLTPVPGGRHIKISIIEVKKEAQEVEYELEYQSGSLLQGFQEVLDLAKLPATTQKLFGSQSAGGAITYHEDIKGGSFQARFLGPENYVLKQDWRYFDNSDKLAEFSSKDAKFKIKSEDLTSNRFLIIYNTPGVPSGLTKRLVSEAYSLTSASKLDGEATISIRAHEEGELIMMGYDGQKWQELETTVKGKIAMAKDAELMELFVVVK